MNRSKNTSFADRLSAAAEAKKAQLERSARARSAAESPAAVERRMAREAVKVARDSRIAERKANKLAIEARQAAALAAAQAAEDAAREVALKAEQEARDAEFASSCGARRVVVRLSLIPPKWRDDTALRLPFPIGASGWSVLVAGVTIRIWS